jgi:replicative DNA helicase
VRLLLLDPVLFQEAEDLTAEDFTSPFLKKTFEMISRRYKEGREVPIASIMAELEPPEASQLTVIMQKPETLASGKTAIRDYIEKIKTEKMKNNARENLLSITEKYRERKGYGG